MTTEPASQRQPKPHPQIPNPRRLLILSPTSQSRTTIPPFLLSLTNTPTTSPTFAGYTTHAPLQIRNKYYTADIPVWVDEVPFPQPRQTKNDKDNDSQPTPSPSPTLWKDEFCSDEARVVRDAIGGVVVCVLNPEADPSLPDADAGQRDDVRAVVDFLANIARVKALVEDERGSVASVVGLVVFIGRGPATSANTGPGAGDDGGGLGDGGLRAGDELFSGPWWEEHLAGLGVVEFEVVGWDPRREDGGRNVFGELQGMRRVKEVLETHDWAADEEGEGLEGGLEERLLGVEGGAGGFELEVDELEREMLGLRMAVERGGDDGDAEDAEDEGQVDAMETLMLRVQAIKDMSADLPESERKRFAAKAVRDIMKEI